MSWSIGNFNEWTNTLGKPAKMSWNIRHFNEAEITNSRALTPCLLLPGWGMNSDIFDYLMPGLAQYFQVYSADYHDLPDSSDEAVAQLATQLPFDKPALLIGWSMGGNLALALAARHPEKVAALCLLACSPSFVARDDWPQGMAEDVYRQFQQGIEQQPQKTLRRFDLLQIKGDSEQTALGKALADYRQQQNQWSQADLQQGLAWLAQFDQRDLPAQLTQPQLWCFGANDQLVHRSTADALAEQLSPGSIITLEECGHLPFLSKPDRFFSAVLDQLLGRSADGKRKMARSFSDAAADYDQAARIQQRAATWLLEKVPMQTPQALLLDAGCGTGRHTAQLAQKGQVIGLDIAEGMLRFARQQYGGNTWLAADAEQLPLTDNSLDGIFSSLAVQWSQQPAALLAEWCRVLKPGGHIWLVTLGTQTLCELRGSFAEADNEPHVNRFASVAQWQQYAQRAGLQLTTSAVRNETDYYPDLASLLRSLKTIGAQTVLYRKTQGLMGKRRWQTVQSAYERFRDEHGLPATYQLIFLCLQKNDE